MAGHTTAGLVGFENSKKKIPESKYEGKLKSVK